MALIPWRTRQAGSSLPSAMDIASPAFKANPYPFYARLRAEAPVLRIAMPDKRTAWLVTRYDDVTAVLKDERFIKNKLAAWELGGAERPWVPSAFKPLFRNMLNLDPPDHTRIRALVQKAFTPALVERMRDRVQALTHELLDRVAAQGRMDLIRDYALPLPSTIIAEMLGVPAKDQGRFHRWSNVLMAVTASFWGRIRAIPTVWKFLRFNRKLIAARRAEGRDDLVTAMVRAEEAGEQLTEDDLTAMIVLLLIAGHETTVNLIGNGTLALLEHPDQMERLRADTALIRPAVEELLRYSSPVEIATERYAREEVTLAGTTIPRGAMMLPVLASANRDERQFANADKLDITRQPNKHIAFGQGIHFCLGASLARLEGQIAIRTLLDRFPDVRLATPRESLRWRGGLLLRGVQALPLAFAGLGKMCHSSGRGRKEDDAIGTPPAGR
ncbi:MAG TPA: cytochrome P450 [Gemmataceae bacterium]|nr:cytochrome P450 [Gemmataceae bacterium]